MSSQHEALVPQRSYIRLHDVTGIERVKPGIKLDYFDYSPCKAKLFLQRGIDGEDRLPIPCDLGDKSEPDGSIRSDHDHYRKHFPSKVVSRRHATLRWMPDQKYPTLEDEQSTHGTFLAHLGIGASLSDVQDEALSKVEWKQMEAHKPVQLEDGDIIQLGKVVKRGEANYTPLRLFVEMFVVGQKPYYYCDSDRKVIDVDEAGETVTKIQQHNSNSISLGESESDDDDVVETEDPKLRQEAEKVIKENKLDVTVIVSDDESDGEDYQPDEEADEELGEVSEDDSESDKIESQGVKNGNVEDQEMEEDSEEGPSSPIDDEEEENSDDNQERSLKLMLECLEGEERHAHDFSDEDEAALEPTQVAIEEQITSTVMQEDGETSAATTKTTALIKEMEQDVEMTTFSDSSSGSADDSSDSEGAATDLTNVEVDVSVPVKEVVSIMEVDTTSTTTDEAKKDVHLPQLAGTKRSHEEIEQVENKDSSTTTLESVPSTATLADNTQPQSASLDSHKKLKTFSAGVAAGLLAGMVGTLIGLSSLALNDSSFL